jgi:hypothetical protein
MARSHKKQGKILQKGEIEQSSNLAASYQYLVAVPQQNIPAEVFCLGTANPTARNISSRLKTEEGEAEHNRDAAGRSLILIPERMERRPVAETSPARVAGGVHEAELGEGAP